MNVSTLLIAFDIGFRGCCYRCRCCSRCRPLLLLFYNWFILFANHWIPSSAQSTQQSAAKRWHGMAQARHTAYCLTSATASGMFVLLTWSMGFPAHVSRTVSLRSVATISRGVVAGQHMRRKLLHPHCSGKCGMQSTAKHTNAQES